MRPRNRSQELVLTQLFLTSELYDTSPQGRQHVIDKLEAAIRADDKRGNSGHWAYQKPRRDYLYQVLKRERAELANNIYGHAAVLALFDKALAEGVES